MLGTRISRDPVKRTLGRTRVGVYEWQDDDLSGQLNNKIG